MIVLCALGALGGVGAIVEYAARDPEYDRARRASPALAPRGTSILALARVSTPLPPMSDRVRAMPLVTLTPQALFLGDAEVMATPSREALVRFGLQGRPTTASDEQPTLPTLFSMLEPYRPAAPRARGPRGLEKNLDDRMPHGGVRVLLSENTPYRALLDIVQTVEKAGHTDFYFISVGPDQRGPDFAFKYSTRMGRDGHRCVEAKVDLLLVPEGVGMVARRAGVGMVAPVGAGCEQGVGLTIPRQQVASQLAACVKKVLHHGCVVRYGITATPEVSPGAVYEVLTALEPPQHDEGDEYRWPEFAAVALKLLEPIGPMSVEEWQRTYSIK